jgi:hypothetical protein
MTSIAVAELAVVASRRALRRDLHRARRGLSRPSSLAAAGAVGALLGLCHERRGPAGVVVGMLAAAMLRHGLKRFLADSAAHLLARRNSP